MCVAEERLKAATSIHFRPYNERYRHLLMPIMPFYKKWMLSNKSGILIPLSFAGCQKYFFDILLFTPVPTRPAPYRAL